MAPPASSTGFRAEARSFFLALSQRAAAYNVENSILCQLPSEMLLAIDEMLDSPLSQHSLRCASRIIRFKLGPAPRPQRGADRSLSLYINRDEKYRGFLRYCNQEKVEPQPGRLACAGCVEVHPIQFFSDGQQKRQPEDRHCLGWEAKVSYCCHASYTLRELRDMPASVNRERGLVCCSEEHHPLLSFCKEQSKALRPSRLIRRSNFDWSVMMHKCFKHIWSIHSAIPLLTLNADEKLTAELLRQALHDFDGLSCCPHAGLGKYRILQAFTGLPSDQLGSLKDGKLSSIWARCAEPSCRTTLSLIRCSDPYNSWPWLWTQHTVFLVIRREVCEWRDSPLGCRSMAFRREWLAQTLPERRWFEVSRGPGWEDLKDEISESRAFGRTRGPKQPEVYDIQTGFPRRAFAPSLRQTQYTTFVLDCIKEAENCLRSGGRAEPKTRFWKPHSAGVIFPGNRSPGF